VGSGKKYHDPPSQAFVELLWKQQEIQPFQLMRIVAWKSAGALAELTLNDENDILIRTRHAMVAILPFRGLNVVTQEVDWRAWRDAAASAIGDEKRGTGLYGLRGVRYPVATAILATLLPDVFPVMDKFAVSSVFGVSLREGESAKFHRADRYKEYCWRLVSSEVPGVREISSVHERDQFFMNLAMRARS
jgi:hypothetical protein